MTTSSLDAAKIAGMDDDTAENYAEAVEQHEARHEDEKPMSDLLRNCTNLDMLTRDEIRSLVQELGLTRGEQDREELIAMLRENGMIA